MLPRSGLAAVLALPDEPAPRRHALRQRAAIAALGVAAALNLLGPGGMVFGALALAAFLASMCLMPPSPSRGGSSSDSGSSCGGWDDAGSDGGDSGGDGGGDGGDD